MATPKNVTMRHIAEVAGVTVATVSMALRGHHAISETTKEKVQRIAKELGYSPDPRFTALMTYLRVRREAPFRATLGYLSDFSQKNGYLKLNTQKEFFRGALERAQALGFQLEPIWVREPGMTSARLIKILKNRGIPGVLMASGDANLWPFSEEIRGVAVAVVGYTHWEPLYPRACNNQFHSMTLCMRRLQETGHQRIGMVMSTQDDRGAEHNWLSAYLGYRYGLPASRCLRPLMGTAEKIFQKSAVEKWLSEQKPDAIIGHTNPLLDLLLQIGVSIPRDISFASFDLFKRDDGLQCSGIDQRSAEVGKAAVDLVALQIASGDTFDKSPPRLVSLEGVWVEGQTTLARPSPVAR